MKCHPSPFLHFSLSLSLFLGYGSNRLKLANLEDYDLGQSWSSNLIPPSPLLQKLKSFITSGYEIASLWQH